MATPATIPAKDPRALPFLFVGDLAPGWVGASNTPTNGLTLYAGFGLVHEGADYGLRRTPLDVILGLDFIVLTRKLLQPRKRRPVGFTEMGTLDARKALLIVGVMTLHSLTEGVSVGVSFVGGQDPGLFVTSAVTVHSIPAGLAISLVPVPRVVVGTP